MIVLLAALALAGAIPESEVIPVAALRPPREVASSAWSTIDAVAVELAPQRGVRLNDRAANGALGGPITAYVRAAADTRDLAILIEWPDGTEDRPAAGDVGAFGDAAAIELPLQLRRPERLPYVGMGDQGAPVLIAMQRAREDGVEAKEVVAEGFGTFAHVQRPRFQMSMSYDAAAKRWRALFWRPLNAAGHDMSRGPLPISIAVWDGAKNQRGGNKSLSGWKVLRFDRKATDRDWTRVLEAEWTLGGPSDPAKGAELFQSMCAPCHRIAGRGHAPADMAPDLAGIAAIATPGYLRRSIDLPNEVVVPHVNVNRHYQKTQPPDANRAHPNEDALAWYTRDEAGSLVSKMPVFELPAEETAAIVSYMLTLRSTP